MLGLGCSWASGTPRLLPSFCDKRNRLRPGGPARTPLPERASEASPFPRAEAVEIEQLRRENEKLTAELTRTKAALEVVGKAHALLELLSESADSGAKRQK